MQLANLRRGTWVLRQVVLVAAGITVYFGTRGLTAGKPSVAKDHAHDLLAFESTFGLDQEHRLQALIDNRDWLADIANWIYIWGHWPVILGVFLWLGVTNRRLFLRLRNAMLVSGGLGLIVYATYPVAPPRLADINLIDTVTERSQAYRVLQPPAFVNQYAALPSLHVGWDLLVGLTVAAAAGTALVKWIGYMMPVLMACAVVLTANHYLIDGISGAALALTGLAAALWWERRQDQRLQQPGAPVTAPVAPPCVVPAQRKPVEAPLVASAADEDDEEPARARSA